MDRIKKILLVRIGTSICNFRCHYCYLAQRDECYQGLQPEMKYTPEQVAQALSAKRIGGHALMNFCAEGETLLTRNIDQYVKALVQEGHYAEVVTNLTVTAMLERFLSWEPELLKRLEFKCSFHYLELKKRGLLNTFAENVKRIWAAGASASIELAPSDELIPYIDEVKQFSMEHFGALPHLTITRNDCTKGIEYLTKLSDAEYDRIWSQFDSAFWRYKRTIFGKKQHRYCYAGKWSMYVDLASGYALPCYSGKPLSKDLFSPAFDSPIPEEAIGACPYPHCYNGHALLTLGLIPGASDVRYGDIRDRIRADGTHWLQPELHDFFNTVLCDSNAPDRFFQRQSKLLSLRCRRIARTVKHRFR